jgi:glutamyl-tRNA synthetase
VGGARTALYNWLLARQSGGSFILRIEDTDLSRSTEEAIGEIVKDLRWLGLEWDEGPEVGGDHFPYRQTGRGALYRQAALRLLEEGKAYRCFCRPEQLAEERKRALAEGASPMYDRRCLKLSPEEVLRRREAGEPFAVRFLVPEGETRFRDMVRGEVVFRHRDIEDFVLLRRDGTPTYNLAVVVDDVEMEITHVVRGDDHLSNTPKQILLYRALGADPPAFAHLPMIVGPDGKPLSKRHGDVAVGRFREMGYLPDAMINFLALLGWSLDDSTTIIDRRTLVRSFSLERVSSKPAVWDMDKLTWMNSQYIMAMGDEDLADAMMPFLVGEGLVEEGDEEARRRLVRAAPLVRERMKVLRDAVPLLAFLFTEVEVEEGSRDLVTGEENRKILRETGRRLLDLEDFSAVEIERTLRSMADDLGLKPRKAFQPVRVAVTGKKVSPPLFESMELLGREKCLQRIAGALDLQRE